MNRVLSTRIFSSYFIQFEYGTKNCQQYYCKFYLFMNKFKNKKDKNNALLEQKKEKKRWFVYCTVSAN